MAIDDGQRRRCDIIDDATMYVMHRTHALTISISGNVNIELVTGVAYMTCTIASRQKQQINKYSMEKPY